MKAFGWKLEDGTPMEVMVTDEHHDGLVLVEMVRDGVPVKMLMSPEDAEALQAMLEAETEGAGHA